MLGTLFWFPKLYIAYTFQNHSKLEQVLKVRIHFFLLTLSLSNTHSIEVFRRHTNCDIFIGLLRKAFGVTESCISLISQDILLLFCIIPKDLLKWSTGSFWPVDHFNNSRLYIHFYVSLYSLNGLIDCDIWDVVTFVLIMEVS